MKPAQEKTRRKKQPLPQRINILFRPTVEGSEALANDLLRRFHQGGLTAKAIPLGNTAKDDLETQDMIVVIGGDGTILRVASMAARFAVPVFGINFGHLGFLAEAQPTDCDAVIPRILAGDYWLEERMMLHTEHLRSGTLLNTFEVLNETVISRGALARPIHLDTWIDGNELSSYTADGIIIATPTGSTAYALAVGGPILPPELKNILIIPIAPHLCNDRAIVLSHGANLKAVVHTKHQAILSADGQVEVPLLDGDEIFVVMSPCTSLFVRVQDQGYFYRHINSRVAQKLATDRR